MPLQSIISSWSARARTQRSGSLQANTGELGGRLTEVFVRMWDLGFTAFGGPPVHFQILHRRFVEGVGFGGGSKWLDEQTVRTNSYQHSDTCANWNVVSRDLCHLSGFTRASLYQNAFHNRNDTCGSRISYFRLSLVELTRSYWHVRSVSWRTKDAR